jgi:hypothetical protein
MHVASEGYFTSIQTRGFIVNVNQLTGRLKLTAAALLLSVAFSSAAIADTGGLRVKVTDADGNPIAGASVNARTSESLTTRSGTTNANGEARLMGLDPSEKYVVTVSADGYQPARNEGALVVTERTYDVPFVLLGATETLEEIVTYGRTDVGQLVDTTSAIQSTDVTLDIMDSLPTGRNYQSYLQMAPTTKPPAVDGGNPSSKSGVNYQDIVNATTGNTAGVSSDNVYYIDGVNITDNQTGTFGANFNSEIIQEQQIITGGVPAEYEGGAGLISRVITKSGTNEFHGSVNYYTQSDSLVADNDNLEDATFSTFDTAFTLGGPIVKDKLWFFTSLQILEREEDVIDPNTQEVLRTVTTDQDLGFAKLTWQATENDKVVAEFFNDPFERDGSTNISTVQNRDTARVQGGDNWKFEYSHAWENVILTANWMSHEGELSTTAGDKTTRNDVAFCVDPTPGCVGLPAVTNADTELGGSGSDTIRFRNKDSINLTLEWFLDTSMGSHDIKFGISDIENESSTDLVYTGDGSQYTSMAARHAGFTFDDYTSGTWNGAQRITAEDYNDIIDGMTDTSRVSADPDYFIPLLDTSGNGAIEEAEVGAWVLSSTAGNPNGEVNVYRIQQTVIAPSILHTEGTALFVQDTWTINDNWTVDFGLRAEEWDHIATNGDTVYTFDYEIAPRLSVIYDVKGDGTSKIWGFYGQYYDPIRTNMTSFAGNLTGSVREEQAYIGDRWVEWQTRGGTKAGFDGFFADTTKTPVTDEFMLGYERALTEDQSIAVTYTKRDTTDILEDYDLCVYSLDCGAPPLPNGKEPEGTPAGGYSLPLSYFGFSETDRPEANFIIATLAGGKREYEGLEVSWRKRRSADSRWFGLASWVYNDAQGNTNSDSNADFQGDLLRLDPRAPNMFGDQPGNVEHLLKLAGSYRWDNGLEIGGTYAWNSGTNYSITQLIARRHFPITTDTPYDSLGVTDSWTEEGTVGTQTTPSYGILNARAKYVVDFGDRYSAEFFLDIFNVLDDQAVRREQDLFGGGAGFDFGDADSWILPRRFYLGARLSF